jgi:hypothetical protein
MTDAFVENFLAGFDDSQYPVGFLDQYEMIECLSHNETGETFLVKNRVSGVPCIAKCYSKSLPISHTAESDLLKKIRHPGLPTFLGEFQNETTFCIVRSYIPGQSLDKYIAEHALSDKETIAIGVQICEILIYLHGQDPPIIHRDIKPQNIILDDRGKVTLIDFGISRVYNAALQEDTVYLGTRHFAAPEQYGFAQTDRRTDIFSLGVLLAWLVTGKLAIKDAEAALADHPLKKIILKCTAFDPKDRYQNAAQVRDALKRRGRKPRGIFALVISVLLLFAAFSFSKTGLARYQQPAGPVFTEPLIEEAVRLTLDISPTEVITEEDLLGIETLRVFGNKVALDDDAIKTYTDLFVNNDGSIQRGGIYQLDDLAQLQNLRYLVLIYQNISVIGPLAQLPYLEYLELKHNPIEDVSPLADAVMLTNLGLFDTKVTDLTALGGCKRLEVLDIGLTPVESLAALAGLDALNQLIIRRTPLQSLDGITNLPMLEEIYLSETDVLDFSPLLTLPRLRVIRVSEAMRPALAEIGAEADFTILYE